MSSISSVAKQYAPDAWASKNAQGVVDALSTLTVDVINSNGVTMGMIGEKLGFSSQVLVSDTLRKILDGQIQIPSDYAVYKGVILDARDRLLADTGMTLYSQDRQQLLEIVGQIGGWSNELITSLKGLGIEKRPVWKHHNLQHAPTLEEVQNEFLSEELKSKWNGKQELINSVKSVSEMVVVLRDIATSLEE